MLPEIVVGFQVIASAEVSSQYENPRNQEGQTDPKATNMKKTLAFHFQIRGANNCDCLLFINLAAHDSNYYNKLMEDKVTT